MLDWVGLAERIPTVISPVQKLSFKEKAKWTLIILVMFFVLGSISIWGINSDAVAQFEFLEIVFGSKFGSIITLGIGPIVTSSIILQLIVGSGIINWDQSTEDGKRKFGAAQKLMTIAFCLIEGIAYVVAGAVPPASPDMFTVSFVIFQLTIGGIVVMYMDEVVSKWGFGSGVSLFIAAGVAKTIMLRTFNPLSQTGGIPDLSIGDLPAGIIPGFIASFIEGNPAFISLLPLVSTLVVFILTVYIMDVRVEVPMAFSMPFGKFAARRWPLKFLYTSNIPVILTAAVLANMQIMGKMLFQRGITILGTYDADGNISGGLMYYLSAPSGEVGLIIMTVLASVLALSFAILSIKYLKKYTKRMAIAGALLGLVFGYLLITIFNISTISTTTIVRAITYMSVYIVSSVIFSVFWTSTASMDAKSVAEQFKSYSIMIPGFRHDPRIFEKVLNRYIPALTVLGGAFVGFLATFADLTSAIGSGTGLLLTVMIIYQLYEQIMQQHGDDIPPSIRKFLGA
ncbi:MAG: preprotein translocase subunit SecY [Candidatus Aenigmarchaeota archaeon]|nr:preprotein translocase subunit SecY [Candidatus Aenigmarchaeota archaeon]